MEQLLQEAIAAVQSSYGSVGMLGAIGVALMYLIRLVRTDGVQARLPAKYQWTNLPQWAKYAFPFLLSFLGAGAVALASAASPLSAALAGLLSGLGAIGLHEVTKALGAIFNVEPPPVPQSLIDKAVTLSFPRPKDLKP